LVSIGELDPSGHKRRPYRLDRSLFQLFSALKSQHGIDPHLRRRGKIPNTQAESPAGHPTLDRQKNSDIIMNWLSAISFRCSANEQSFAMSFVFYSQGKFDQPPNRL
jgi:hypothetical protein